MALWNRLLVATALVGLALPAGAASLDPARYAGSFNCDEEISGGLIYDTDSSAWVATTFKPGPTFHLDLEYQGPSKKYPEASTFHASIVVGSDDPKPCTSAYTDDINPDVAATDDVGVFECTTVVARYRFAMSKLRFLRTYELGYVLPDDTDDSPSISGGTCTRVLGGGGAKGTSRNLTK